MNLINEDRLSSDMDEQRLTVNNLTGRPLPKPTAILKTYLTSHLPGVPDRLPDRSGASESASSLFSRRVRGARLSRLVQRGPAYASDRHLHQTAVTTFGCHLRPDCRAACDRSGFVSLPSCRCLARLLLRRYGEPEVQPVRRRSTWVREHKLARLRWTFDLSDRSLASGRLLATVVLGIQGTILLSRVTALR
jgi:hypothetical protein